MAVQVTEDGHGGAASLRSAWSEWRVVFAERRHGVQDREAAPVVPQWKTVWHRSGCTRLQPPLRFSSCALHYRPGGQLAVEARCAGGRKSPDSVLVREHGERRRKGRTCKRDRALTSAFHPAGNSAFRQAMT